MSEPSNAVGEVPTKILPPLSLEDMIFDDITPVQVKVWVKGDPYLLREASAAAAAAYDNAKMRATKVNDKGRFIGFDGLADAELILLSNCLHPVDKGTLQPALDHVGNLKPTPVERLRGWLDRVVLPLRKKLKEISPSLQTTETKEDIKKEIAKLTEQLADLETREAGGETGDAAKNAPGAGTEASA